MARWVKCVWLLGEFFWKSPSSHCLAPLHSSLVCEQFLPGFPFSLAVCAVHYTAPLYHFSNVSYDFPCECIHSRCWLTYFPHREEGLLWLRYIISRPHSPFSPVSTELAAKRCEKWKRVWNREMHVVLWGSDSSPLHTLNIHGRHGEPHLLIRRVPPLLNRTFWMAEKNLQKVWKWKIFFKGIYTCMGTALCCTRFTV